MTVLPDVLAKNLAIVFCGSAAGAASARRGAYYAGPGNSFWPTLHAVGLTPRLMPPEEFRRLPEFGLGLTDLAKRYAGADAGIARADDDPEALRAKIERFAPRVLAFVGKRPAAVFLNRTPGHGLQDERIGETVLWVLPSPSGAARRWWDERPWRELADYVGRSGVQ